MKNVLARAAWTLALLACMGAGDPADHKKTVQRRVAPTAVTALREGGAFVDFGVAAFGFLEFTPPKGARGPYEVWLGERMTPEGRLDRRPGATIRAVRVAGTIAADGVHRVPLPPDPRNTSGGREGGAVPIPPEHGVVLPFRCAEVVRAPFPVSRETVRMAAVEYPMDMDASAFSCDAAAIMEVYDLCKRTIRATSFAGLYVDGDRERIPYEADAYLNQLGEYAVHADYSLARASFAYLMDHPTWPTEWQQHMVKMAWTDWMWSGDARALARFYDRLKGEKLLLRFRRADGLLRTGGERLPQALTNACGAADIVDWPPGERDGFVFRDVNAVVNAFHYRNLLEMADIARALGKTADADAFLAGSRAVHAAFQKVFFDPARRVYRDGEGTDHASLHANAAALAFGLVPPGARPDVVRFCASRKMACSVYFAQYLLEAFFEAGRADLAIGLMSSTGDRSWRGMLDQGATLTMEAWAAKYKPNLDWNHAWGAAPLNVLSRYVLGVTPFEPGFAKIRVAPQVGPLRRVEGTVPTAKGPVRVCVVSNETLVVETPAPARIEFAGQVRDVPAGRHVCAAPRPQAGEVDLSAGRAALPGNAFTVALAVAPEAQTNAWDGRAGYVCGLGTGYWDGFRLRLKPTRLGCEPSLEIGRAKGREAFLLEAPGAVLPAGVPRLLAASWDGKTARLYVGARCVAEKPFAGTYAQEGALPFQVGRAAYGLGLCPFRHGRARVWNAALPAEEIARLAEEAARGAPSDDAVAACAARPLRAVAETYAAGTIEPAFREMAAQILFRALCDGRTAELPVRALDLFGAAAGWRDPRRSADFQIRRAAALAREGRVAESRAAYVEAWERAKAARAPYAAWAGLACADALARAGDGEAAAAVRTEAGALARGPLRGECGGAARAFFVSPTGCDADDGTHARPFATLARAQRAVREVKARGPLPPGGVTVWLRGGVYPVRETLAFTAADAGAPGAPVRWAAWRDETPVLDGGWRVPGFDLGPEAIARRHPEAARRIPPAARPHVVACDVRAAGYPHFGPRPAYGFHCGEAGTDAPITDLYCAGRPLPLAREPNEGWLQTGEVLDAQTNRVFRSGGGDLAQWRLEPEAMLTGYWRWHWADLTLHVPPEGFDPAADTVALGRGHGSWAPREHRPYFLVNALCALDRPGEWYLDRAAGVLYAWPDPGGADYVLSAFDAPFITLDGVTDFALEGLVLQHGRGTALKAARCARLVFEGNVVRRFGNDGAWFLDARDVAIRGNVLRDFGHGALRVSGGDRKTLAPSGISVTDNEIAWVERWKRTYAPGLHGAGCGTEVARNHFHDMRSSAMRLEGNDWWIASNVVERVVTESDDQGGVDIFANPSYAGNVICFNVWRDVGCGGENAPCGQAGVRFDDAVSTMTVYANLFENCSFGHFGAVQMNGGRNNVVDNNVFVNCAKGVSIGRWPKARWEAYFARPNVRRWRTCEVDVGKPPYADRYPGIADLPRMPLVNWLTRNVTVGRGALTDGPETTVLFGNRAFEAMPSAEALAQDPGFRPLPPERELGPRPTAAFARARRNDARKGAGR